MTESKRMLLLFPYTGHDCVPALPPLSACFLSTSAKKAGWFLDHLDGQLYKGPLLTQKLTEHIREYDAFGISVYSGYVEQAIAIARIIRQNSSSPIIWGGPHPTLFPGQLEKHELADFVVSGYGEGPLEFLLRNNFMCRDHILYGTCDPSLATHLPDYSVFEMEAYNAINGRHVASLMTSRGCKYNCRFCINSIRKQTAVFMAEGVVEEVVRNLVLRYRIGDLSLMDEHFYRDDTRILWFCKLMAKYNISWEANIRADIIARLSGKVMKVLARSNCRRINMGMESASDRILKLLGKGIVVSDYLAAVNRCKKYGIPMSASFMIDLPTETEKEKDATMTMARLLRGVGVIVFGPMRYRPVPGTDITDQMLQERQEEYPPTLEGWVNSKFTSKYMSNDWENVNW